jgi:hypothetical protein
MRDKWWRRPIRDRWYLTDPANFFLAAILLLFLGLATALLLTSWNPWLLLFALIVVPLWALFR